MSSHTLISLYDFENRQGLFPAVDSRYRFSAITISGSPVAKLSADFVFFAQDLDDLAEPTRHVQYSAEDIALLNPLSGNCPAFRDSFHAELVKWLYKRADLRLPPAEVLWDWAAEPTFLFVMSDHSNLFSTRMELGCTELSRLLPTAMVNGELWLPLYESKMFHQYDHRWASFETDGIQRDLTIAEKNQPRHLAAPRYWMRETDAAVKLGDLPKHDWLLAIREVTNSTNERTTIAAVLPKCPVGHNSQVFRFEPTAPEACAFLANLNAFVLDFAARTKVGGSHMSSFILRQLPILPSRCFSASAKWGREGHTLRDWLLDRIIELLYTAWDLQPFAQDCGWSGSPFQWDEERRFLIRGELDAAFFHLYLGQISEWRSGPSEFLQRFPTPRHAVDHIMETFPIVREKDIKQYGTYRTKNTILSIYDAMQHAIDTGEPYQTLLDPPPADPRVAHHG